MCLIDFSGDGGIFTPIPNMHTKLALVNLNEHLRRKLAGDVSFEAGYRNRQTVRIRDFLGL